MMGIVAQDLELENATRHGRLVRTGEHCWVYKWHGHYYVTEPTITDRVDQMVFETLVGETAHPESEVDRAVREAGFAAEPLTQALEEIYAVAHKTIRRSHPLETIYKVAGGALGR